MTRLRSSSARPRTKFSLFLGASDSPAVALLRL